MPTRPVNKKQKKSSSNHAEPHADRPVAPGYGIVGPKSGKGLLPWTWVSKRMNACRTFWLATIYAGKNRPHVMPIWGVWVDDGFFFSTGRKSRKGRNIAACPACTISNDDSEEAVIVDGDAVEVTDKLMLEKAAQAYMKKYKIDPRTMGEPLFVVHPERVFGLIEKTFPQSATRWRLNHKAS